MESKNIYVGNRYVPKIMGVWNSSFEYEGLSIVQWEGNSFTSKKLVPPNILLSNEEYWVSTGNYNAQIENYRSEVKQATKDLNTYKIETDEKIELNKTTINDNKEQTDVLIQLNKEQTDVLIQLNKEQTEEELAILMELKEDKNTSFINVKNYGITGSNIDETLKMQTLLDSDIVKSGSTIFFPEPLIQYRFTQLEVPANKTFLHFLGSGRDTSKMIFESTIAWKVSSEQALFEKLCMYGSGTDDVGSTLFKDTRPNNLADFDIKIMNCRLHNVQTVVETRGRGVNIEDGCSLSNIRYQIILIDYPSKLDFQEGGEDIQKYETGFRHFVFRNNRVHYSPCNIFKNIGENSLNARGFQITGNTLEGSTGYFEGDAIDILVSDNLHYDVGDVRTALFTFGQLKNAKLDLSISGRDVMGSVSSTNFNECVRVNKKYDNVTITGYVRNCFEHVFHFLGGGTNLNINVVGELVAKKDSYNFVCFDGGKDLVYNGVTISGSVRSPRANFVAINRWNDEGSVMNYYIPLQIIASFNKISNLEATKPGNHPPIVGTFTGTGNRISIVTPNRIKQVTIVNKDGYVGMSTVGSTGLTAGIEITTSGFDVWGSASAIGIDYGYTAI